MSAGTPRKKSLALLLGLRHNAAPFAQGHVSGLEEIPAGAVRHALSVFRLGERV